jgi:hypothetical protein
LLALLGNFWTFDLTYENTVDPIGLASVSFKGDLLQKVTSDARLVPEEKNTSFFASTEDESDIFLLRNRTYGL